MAQHETLIGAFERPIAFAAYTSVLLNQRTRRSSEYDLVSFEKPPVAEVALCFQFTPQAVDLDALSLFAQRVRTDLPRRELQPVAPPMVETFDVHAVAPTFEFHLDPPAVLPRTWFLSDDGVQLVQLQHDRLTLNWRELGTGSDYPRYDQLRTRFEELIAALSACYDELGRGAPPINMCEVTYVNPIEAVETREGGAGHADLADVINRLRTRPDKAFLPEAEDAHLQARWRIPGEELDGSGPIGRLYLAASPGLKPPKNLPIYMVNLTARVIPTASEPADAWRAMDVAHRWVVLGFADLTTTKMHKLWGKKEGSR